MKCQGVSSNDHEVYFMIDQQLEQISEVFLNFHGADTLMLQRLKYDLREDDSANRRDHRQTMDRVLYVSLLLSVSCPNGINLG